MNEIMNCSFVCICNSSTVVSFKRTPISACSYCCMYKIFPEPHIFWKIRNNGEIFHQNVSRKIRNGGSRLRFDPTAIARAETGHNRRHAPSQTARIQVCSFELSILIECSRNCNVLPFKFAGNVRTIVYICQQTCL